MNMPGSTKNIILCSIALLIWCSVSLAQKYNFTKINYEDGLSHSSVTCILKDYMGFMWFGTPDGLNRYDGYNIRLYKKDKADSTSLAGNNIVTLLEDSKNNLWIGTDNGLSLYNREKDNFTNFRKQENNEGLKWNYVSALTEGKHNNLWIGTGRGLDMIQSGSMEFRNFDKLGIIHVFDHFKEKNISSLFFDSNRLWIGTRNHGISVINFENNNIEAINIAALKDNINVITSIFKDTNHNYWIGTNKNGVFILDPSFNVLLNLHHQTNNPSTISNNKVLDIMHDNNENIWVSVENAGIDVFNLDYQKITNISQNNDENSLSKNSAWTMYNDNTGGLWLGCYNGGVNFYHKKNIKFSHKKIVETKNSTENSVLSFLEDSENTLWIGTDGGGLYRKPENKENFRKFNYQKHIQNNPNHEVIFDIIEYPKGTIWISTWGEGLYKYDLKSDRINVFQRDINGNEASLSSNTIRTLEVDDSGNIWVGTFGGGINIISDDAVIKHYTHVDNNPFSLVNNWILDIFKDVEGNMWIGTAEGLSFFDVKNQQFVNYKQDENDSTSISHNIVNYIYQDANHNIWIATTGGLNLFDPEKNAFIHCTEENDLPNNVINAILEDNHRNLWVSTNKGIARINRENFNIHSYDLSDGLQGNKFNQQACMVSKEGLFYFGGLNGYNAFDPDEVSNNSVVPPVIITGFQLFNKNVEWNEEESPLQHVITHTDKITLDHTQSVFSFEFAALNYIQPEKNKYAFKLEGFEKSWNEVGNQRKATYTALPPGEYTFKVKASNNDGVWNLSPTSVKIEILPPPWKTWWALSIYVLIFIGVLIAFVKYTMLRVRDRNNLRMEKMEKENLKKMNQMKLQFFTNIAHEVRTPLTLMIDPLDKLIASPGESDERKKKLTLIERNAKILLRLFNQLIDFRKIESNKMALHAEKADLVRFIGSIFESFQLMADQKNIDFHYLHPDDIDDCWFDRDKIETIIYNLLSNAFKYTPERGHIAVILEAEESHIVIKIEDTGIGIPKEKLDLIFERFYQVENAGNTNFAGSGIGLALTKKLVEIHHGELDVQSEMNKGTTFIFKFPRGMNYLQENERVMYTSDTEYVHYISNHPKIDNNYNQVENTSRNGKKPLVMIVEDNPDVRDYIRENLSEKYTFIEASNGLEALDLAFKKVPDIIVTDVMMPDMDGITLSKKIKSDLKTSHLPIIILSARTSVEHKIEGLRTEADAYIDKPFHLDHLDIQIKNILHTRKKLRKIYGRNSQMLRPYRALTKNS
jgi:signal transduction histidine kinase/ligand-binding sensor domain-containing protein/CheY-like chemotaxis protein